MPLQETVGMFVRQYILTFAGLLKNEATSGLVSLGLILLLVSTTVLYVRRVMTSRSALAWLQQLIVRASKGQGGLGGSIDGLTSELRNTASTRERRTILAVWGEYRETFVPHEEGGTVVLRNSVRPQIFFNADDLGFGPGGWRIWPGLFVTVGLFFTFLGLVSALAAVNLAEGQAGQSLEALLKIASAKFTMSLTGLLCSIIFTIVLRRGMSSVDQALHVLCEEIEGQLSFISLEELAVEQLAAIREQREHFRTIGLELVAELGRPLREELPKAISDSIGDVLKPALDGIGKAGAEGVGDIVRGLSDQFSRDVGRALTEASERLAQAGDRLGQLADRLDQSSNRMGSEIDSAVLRLSQSVDDLRSAMGATAETAGGAISAGAEKLLAVMNETLTGIRDNTGEGARAMNEAAGQMKAAAESFRQELEAATKAGADSVKDRIGQAGAEAGGAIETASRNVLTAFEGASAKVAALTQGLSEKTAEVILDPLDDLAEELGGLVESITKGTNELKRFQDGVRAGAEASEQAAGHFRGASQDLVAAAAPIRTTVEKLEGSVRTLGDSTNRAADTVARSAERTAAAAAEALEAAQAVLKAESDGIEKSLRSVGDVVERMRGQGAKLDDIDTKLGKAFDEYTMRVEAAVNGMQEHVRKMQLELAPALDTLRAIVDQAEQFAPQQQRAGRR